MALVLCSEDFIRFTIVGVSLLASLWFLWRNEFGNTRKDGNKAYKTDGSVAAMQRNHVSSSQLWTSCWKSVHPGWLLATRLVSFLILAYFLSLNLMDCGLDVFIYYSGCTYVLLMVYFAIGIAMSAYGCWLSAIQTLVAEEASVEFLRRVLEEIGTTNSIIYRIIKQRGSIKLKSQNAENSLKMRAGFWGNLMQVIYQICGGAVFLTDFLFWGIFFPLSTKEELTLTMVMSCNHIFNALCLLLETALNNLPFPWFRITYCVIWGGMYCIFQWVIHACGFTWWPYPFLEFGKSWSPYWYLVLVLLHFPCYGAYVLIFKAKNYFFSKWFPKDFGSHGDMIKHAKEQAEMSKS